MDYSGLSVLCSANLAGYLNKEGRKGDMNGAMREIDYIAHFFFFIPPSGQFSQREK